MRQTFNRGLFSKLLHSRLNENVLQIIDTCFVRVSSRNSRVQADYGCIYMTKILVASQEGIQIDDETEKLIVTTNVKHFVRLFSSVLHIQLMIFSRYFSTIFATSSVDSKAIQIIDKRLKNLFEQVRIENRGKSVVHFSFLRF